MKLSIITINYNNLEGLKKTLKSVFDQSFRDFEYIIIDGGSTDGSKEYLEKYDDKISYWVSEIDDGIYNAMNKGIKIVNGEFLLFLNSGDYLFSEEILEILVYYSQGVDIIYGDLIFEGNSKKFEIGKSLDLKYFLSNTIGHAASIIKKDLFNLIGLYNEENKIVSDWEFFVKAVVIHNVKYLHVGEVITVYQNGGISTSNEFTELQISERTNFLKSHFPKIYALIEENDKLIITMNNYFNSSLIKGIFKLIYLKMTRKHYNSKKI